MAWEMQQHWQQFSFNFSHLPLTSSFQKLWEEVFDLTSMCSWKDRLKRCRSVFSFYPCHIQTCPQCITQSALECSDACFADREMGGVSPSKVSANIMATVSKNYDLHFHVLTEVQHCNSIWLPEDNLSLGVQSKLGQWGGRCSYTSLSCFHF